MLERSSVEQILDARHAAAQVALQSRDIAAYEDIFSPDLAYTQLDGVVLGRDQLMRDVTAQFLRLDHARTSYIRERLDLEESGATETLAQTVIARVTVFALVHRIWRVERRGHYTWSNQDGAWRIMAVTVLAETTTSALRFGLKPPA